ncbi:contactin-associated protein-like 2 [Pocillopora verrucosa]|uniref:contactin-associated protein-like 2 n=1 Tax=Pocillopora verrucosa TaxID=203993 RepID=UPI0033405769
MLLLPLLLFFPSLLGLMFAVQNSALYRYPTGRVSFGKFKCDPYYYLWEEKLKSSIMKDQLECSFLCIGEPKCSSFNIAAFPDTEGLYLCELLANDKFRGTGNSFKNASFHHFSPWSPCESAPCKNGGVCVPEYERNSYRCDCKPGFCGTHCKRGGDKSCSQIKLCSLPSGSYEIDPDGEGGVKPFKVYCDMTDKDGVGVTVVNHDSESRTLVNGFETSGSYSRNITYMETDLVQLASLTASSVHCEQFIKYECYSTALFRNSKADGWWVALNGEKMFYWGGVDSDPYKCACSLNNTCADPDYDCNCDKNDNTWREDSGFLTDKSKLPVTQLRFGDTGITDDGIDEKAYHTLGKLKCYGLK